MSTDWTANGNFLLPQNIDERSTTKKLAVGTEVQAKHATYGVGTFTYMAGAASTSVRDWVTLEMDSGVVVRLVANAIGPVGIAMASITASYYGWFARVGKILGNCLTLFADNGRVYITSTAATVDDASVAGDVVWGAKGASTATVGNLYAEFEIDRPFVADRVSIIS